MERAYTFLGGADGPWRVLRVEGIGGEPLPRAARVDVVNALIAVPPPGANWLLRGVTSNERYVTRAERERLIAIQPGLGRPQASRAALIPIRKSASWWQLSQDERREIIEARSEHISTGMRYLPAVARRLHHSRDLGEPFDFITWFEYAPEHSEEFEDLVARLRATEEWKYVEREVDVRLILDSAA
jgi:hypothetical protein